MVSLLDVNVLIALLDQAHVHHQVASRWLSAHIDQGWASCPLTQTAVVRIMSQPAYPGALRAIDVAQRLAQAARHPAHRFWPADVNLLDVQAPLEWHRLLGHRQLADAYLLALAVRRHGRLVTLDRRIDHAIVPGATAEQLQRIPLV